MGWALTPAIPGRNEQALRDFAPPAEAHRRPVPAPARVGISRLARCWGSSSRRSCRKSLRPLPLNTTDGLSVCVCVGFGDVRVLIFELWLVSPTTDAGWQAALRLRNAGVRVLQDGLDATQRRAHAPRPNECGTGFFS
jgi:hypothetical protein